MDAINTEIPDRLAHFDFAAHNDEVKQVWATFRAGHPMRVPMILGTNTRYFMFNSAANPDGISFEKYLNDPDVMFDSALRFARWTRFNLLQDAELGLPEQWCIGPDFQNVYEAAWYGCPIEYMDDQVPDTRPAFVEAPERVMEKGLPDPFGGLMATALRYHEHFKRRAAGMEFLGRPVKVGPPSGALGTDGPFTGACNLFGAGQVCEMAIEDPDRLHRLLAFITDANIARQKAWRADLGMPPTSEDFGIADDSIALISTDLYRQVVLPYHRRLFDCFGPAATTRGIHLCGDATRHFVTIRDELGVTTFDTGFPVDFAAIRRRLGPKVRIQGGPHVELLLSATPQAVRQETLRILNTGVADHGNFILREGNNLAPHTPIENTEAMYAVAKQWRPSRSSQGA